MFKFTVTHLAHNAPCSIQRSGSLPRDDAADTAGVYPSAPAAVGIKKPKPAPGTGKPQKQKTEKQMLEQACPSVS